jgi:hypothetical protein
LLPDKRPKQPLFLNRRLLGTVFPPKKVKQLAQLPTMERTHAFTQGFNEYLALEDAEDADSDPVLEQVAWMKDTWDALLCKARQLNAQRTPETALEGPGENFAVSVANRPEWVVDPTNNRGSFLVNC